MKWFLILSINAVGVSSYAQIQSGFYAGKIQVYGQIISIECELNSFNVTLAGGTEENILGRCNVNGATFDTLSIRNVTGTALSGIEIPKSVPGLQNGDLRSSGDRVCGHSLQGTFHAVSPTFEGTVIERHCNSARVPPRVQEVGTFKIGRRSDSIGEPLNGTLSVQFFDSADKHEGPTIFTIYEDNSIYGHSWILDPSNPTSSSYFTSNFDGTRSTPTTQIFAWFPRFNPNSFNPYFFEGPLANKKFSGEVFNTKFDPLIGNYVKDGAAIGTFKFE